MEEKKEKEELKEEKKPFNHVLEVQNGFIDVNWIFNRNSKEVIRNGKSGS